jgi:hypothetical protein
MARPKKEDAKNRFATVGIRLTPWAREGLDRIAKEEGVPLSDVVYDAIVAHLKRHGIKEPR